MSRWKVLGVVALLVIGLLAFIGMRGFTHRHFEKVIQTVREAAREISHPPWRSSAFVAIAKASHKTRDFEEVRESAREISHPPWRSSAFIAIAEASYKTRDFEAACEAAREISHPCDKSEAFVAIGEALAEVIK